MSNIYRIRELRERRGMSQEQLADKAGVSRTILSELETGKRNVTKTDTLMKISKALGYSIKNIFL